MSNRNKQKELKKAAQKEQDLEELLRFSKKRFKRLDEVIENIFSGVQLQAHFGDKRIEKITHCFQKLKSKSKLKERICLMNTLIQLNSCSSLVKEEAYIQAIFNMVAQKAYWKKDIADWKPSSKCVKRQMNELVYHLFCDYPVPAFLYKSFFEQDSLLYSDWFILIGTGKKVKDLPGMPIPFTQKTGHYFLQAPAQFSIAEALRWSQAKAMNADDRLAGRIAYSWLGTKTYNDEDFWETFIRTIVNAAMFNTDELGGLIDFVREQRRQIRNYSLKGRTVQPLLRQSHAWHKTAIQVKGDISWDPSGLYGYKLERKEETIVIEELTGSTLLTDEGRTMKHCVASYVHQCKAKRSAIFSLRKYTTDLLLDTMATIEVSLPTRRIMQAKAKMNRKINDEARKYLEAWAYKNQLSISPHL